MGDQEKVVYGLSNGVIFKGLACPNLEWRFPTLDATLTHQFQDQTVKGQC